MPYTYEEAKENNTIFSELLSELDNHYKEFNNTYYRGQVKIVKCDNIQCPIHKIPHGLGKMFFKDSNLIYYEGQWKDGDMHGLGVRYTYSKCNCNNCDSYVLEEYDNGVWVNDNLLYGARYIYDNKIFEGRWNNGVIVEGKAFTTDGKEIIYDGKFDLLEDGDSQIPRDALDEFYNKRNEKLARDIAKTKQENNELKTELEQKLQILQTLPQTDDVKQTIKNINNLLQLH